MRRVPAEIIQRSRLIPTVVMGVAVDVASGYLRGYGVTNWNAVPEAR